MIRHPLVRLAIFVVLVTLAFLNQNGTLGRWFGAREDAGSRGRPAATADRASDASEARADGAMAPARATRVPAPERERHPDVGFRSRESLDEHFRKHGAEFSAGSAAVYLKLAQALRDDPPGPGILEATRSDGVRCRYHRPSGSFLAFDPDLTIRTFFRPHDGEAYFRRQLEREP